MADVNDFIQQMGNLPPDSNRACPLCNKPFVSSSSYHRHLSYCRRSQSRPKTRQRSCRACSAAKTKCTFTIPCSRCIKKGTDCEYDGRARRDKGVTDTGAEEDAVHNPTTSLMRQESPPLSQGPIFVDENFAFNFIDLPVTDHFISDITELGNDNFTLDFDTLDGAASVQYDLSTPFTPDEIVHLINPDPSKVLGFLTRISSSTSLAEQAANFLIESLCAIPEQMLRQASFPSFIHPHRESLAMPEALTVGMQIAGLFASRTSDVKPFIWRTILAEQKRVLKELHIFSKQDLLAIIQAHMVYLVMRVIDGGPGSNSWNQDMILSLNIICDRFLFLCNGHFSEDEQSNPSLTWEDWIFAESRRRSACVWYLVTRTFVVKTLPGCPTTEKPWTLPLPSPKPQWEARSRLQWMEEMDAASIPMATFGDLMESNRKSREPHHAQRLRSWNATADNLGQLLNIAVAVG